MSYQRLSNTDLLAMLVGQEKAVAYSQTTLSVLFGMRQMVVCENQPLQYAPTILSAAKELVVRALSEELALNAINLANPNDVRNYLRLLLSGRGQEVFVVLFLDAQRRLIATEEMFNGTLTQASVYPREVVKRALFHNAAAVIFAHNHPSGSDNPSHADKQLTDVLKSALALVDVRAIDHFIIGDGSALSFSEKGLI